MRHITRGDIIFVSLVFSQIVCLAAVNDNTLFGSIKEAIGFAISMGSSILLLWLWYEQKKRWTSIQNEITELHAGQLRGSGQGSEFVRSDALIHLLFEIRSKFYDVIQDTKARANSIAMTASLMSTENDALAGRTKDQSTILQSAKSDIKQLSEAVSDNANCMEKALTCVKDSTNSAACGSEVVANVIETMTAIQKASARVAEIIQMIEAIAFQTNILALNAAVEAARAGEKGRGFAVVASEVRELATKCTAAASEVTALIQQQLSSVEQGNLHAAEAGVAIGRIVDSVMRVSDLIGSVSHSTIGQVSRLETVDESFRKLEATTNHNRSLVIEINSVAASLHQQAVAVTQCTSDFDLGESEFGDADAAVRLVKRALEYAKAKDIKALIDEVNRHVEGTFIDRDLYIIVMTVEGKIVAHGTNPRLVGTDGINLRDSDGKPFVKQMVAAVKLKREGWVDFKYSHPVTKALMSKTAYFESHGSYFVSCGFYKTGNELA